MSALAPDVDELNEIRMQYFRLLEARRDGFPFGRVPGAQPAQGIIDTLRGALNSGVFLAAGETGLRVTRASRAGFLSGIAF